jgi:hypothetical protein
MNIARYSKAVAGGLGSAVATVIVWFLANYVLAEAPPAAIGEAIAELATWVLAIAGVTTGAVVQSPANAPEEGE